MDAVEPAGNTGKNLSNLVMFKGNGSHLVADQYGVNCMPRAGTAERDWFCDRMQDQMAECIDDYMKGKCDECLYCGIKPGNRTKKKVGLRSHMAQCGSRKELLLDMMSDRTNCTRTNQSGLASKRLQFLEALEDCTGKEKAKSCMVEFVRLLTKHPAVTALLSSLPEFQSSLDSIAHLTCTMLPALILPLAFDRSVQRLEADYLQAAATCFFAHLVEQNLSASDKQMFSPEKFVSLLLSSEGACFEIARDMWSTERSQSVSGNNTMMNIHVGTSAVDGGLRMSDVSLEVLKQAIVRASHDSESSTRQVCALACHTGVCEPIPPTSSLRLHSKESSVIDQACAAVATMQKDGRYAMLLQPLKPSSFQLLTGCSQDTSWHDYPHKEPSQVSSGARSDAIVSTLPNAAEKHSPHIREIPASETPSPSSMTTPSPKGAHLEDTGQYKPIGVKRPADSPRSFPTEVTMSISKKRKSQGNEGEDRKKKKWTKDADARLKAMVMEGDKDWNEIHMAMDGYTESQCRQRWFENLAPGVQKGRWTVEEDKAILKYQKQFGNRWTDIARYLKGRTDNMIKNRYYSTMRRVKRNVATFGRRKLTQELVQKRYAAYTNLEYFILEEMRLGLQPWPTNED